GVDATLGLAFAATGVLYPFFGTLLGWLGVALTGSDTASNILFGNLQKITSEQIGLSPVLMAAANSSGGVMGKVIDGQAIVGAGDRRGIHRHQLVRPRGLDPALRVQALDHPGLSCRHPRHAAGLCLSVHDDGHKIAARNADIESPRSSRRGDFSVRFFRWRT